MKKLFTFLSLVFVTSVSLKVSAQDSSNFINTGKQTVNLFHKTYVRKLDAANSLRDQSFANKAAGSAQTSAVSTASIDATSKANAAVATSNAYTDAKFLEGYKAGYKSADSLIKIRLGEYQFINDSLYLRKSDQIIVLPGDKIRFDSTGIKTIKISAQ